jgi:hypothetical protein
MPRAIEILTELSLLKDCPTVTAEFMDCGTTVKASRRIDIPKIFKRIVQSECGVICLFLMGANVPQIAVVADLRSEKLSAELETNI